MKATDLDSEQKRYLISEYQKNELLCVEIAQNFNEKYNMKLPKEYVGRWMALWGVPKRDSATERRVILERRYGRTPKPTWL